MPDTNPQNQPMSEGGVALSPLVLPSYEYLPTEIHFRCSHAVYPVEGQSSVCYVTSEERAKFIVAALEHFHATGAMDEYLRQPNRTTFNHNHATMGCHLPPIVQI